MFRRLLLIICSGIFKLSLFLTAVAASLVMVFGNSSGLKQALDKSNLYDSIVDSFLEESKKNLRESPNIEEGQLQIDQPEVREAFQAALPPEKLKQDTEIAIDSIFSWLQGKTEKPDFRIDLTEAKQTFATKIGNYAVKRFEGLPTCTPQQLRTMNQNVDPLSVNCRPPGLSSETVHQEVTSKLLNEDSFLKDPIITADSLRDARTGESPFEKLAGARDVYGFAKSLPLLLGGISLLMGLAILFLHTERRKGWRNIGVTLLGTGLFLVLISWIVTFMFHKLNQPGSKFIPAGEQTELQANAVRMARELTNTYNSAIIKFSLIYMVLGAGILFTLWYMAKRARSENAPEHINGPLPPVDDSPKEPELPEKDPK